MEHFSINNSKLINFYYCNMYFAFLYLTALIVKTHTFSMVPKIFMSFCLSIANFIYALVNADFENVSFEIFMDYH